MVPTLAITENTVIAKKARPAKKPTMSLKIEGPLVVGSMKETDAPRSSDRKKNRKLKGRKSSELTILTTI